MAMNIGFSRIQMKANLLMFPKSTLESLKILFG